MPTANDVIAHSLTLSGAMLHRYADDLTPQEMLHRPTPKANCAAWTVGHLAMSDRYALKMLGGALPELPEGFDKRFSRDEGCPQAEEFGDVSAILPVFDQHRDALIEVAKSVSAEQLDKRLEKPIAFAKTFGEALSFIAMHTSMHAGQIVIIRRSLGRPPLM